MQTLIKKSLTIIIQFLALFTWSKSFRNNPFIGSPILNTLGLHVIRVAISHGLFNIRLLFLSPLAKSLDRKTFKQQGYLSKPNFLTPEQFKSLKQELANYDGEIREVIEGDTTAQRIMLTEDILTTLPSCKELTRYSPLSKLLRYTSSKNRLPVYHIENVIQDPSKHHAQDPQQHMHTDTFHPCMKAWLFIDDVTLENGPFNYIARSQQLTWKRLKWEYKESINASKNRHNRTESRYWDGAFRITVEDRALLKLATPSKLTVSANTLVIANTHGFHCRGLATKPSSRLAIWMQARDNPFNPFFSPFPRLTARLFEKIWLPQSLKLDQRLLKNGQLRHKQGGFDLNKKD